VKRKSDQLGSSQRTAISSQEFNSLIADKLKADSSHDSIRMRGRTTIRGPWHEVIPDEPPGVYKHVVDGTPCWCKPVTMGNVIVHRPFAKCKAEILAEIAKRAKQA
jgi:hypothetical protein